MGVGTQPDGQQLRRVANPILPPVREDAEAGATCFSDSEALIAGRAAGEAGLMIKQGQWRHVFGLAAGAALVAMVVIAAYSAAHAGPVAARPAGGAESPEPAVGPPPSRPGRPRACTAELLEKSLCPLRSLFDDPDVHKVSTTGILQVGAGMLESSDEELVTETVAQVFGELSLILQQRAAPVALALDEIDLSAEEKDALLVHLRLLADAKVRSFGLDVARAMRESPSPEPEYLKKNIQERLVPRLEEIDSFSKQAIPKRLSILWGKGREWSMTLDPVNIRSMEAVSGKFVDSYRPEKQMLMKEKVEAVRDGALEFGKSLLDFLLLCINDMGPEFSTDVGDTMAVAGDGPLSWPCQLDADGESHFDFDKGLICPLKFGAQGLDAMRVLGQS